jgi:Protein of unknown function (DUF1553)/Protein of unknown function (DUF1549)/Planctomycete cytochrome C
MRRLFPLPSASIPRTGNPHVTPFWLDRRARWLVAWWSVGRLGSWAVFASLVCGFATTSSGAEPAASTVAVAAEGNAEGLEFFEQKVRPLLSQRCLECHSGVDAKGSLRLDSKAGLLAGGDTGPAVVPGKPAESLLVDAVNYGQTYQMPPKSRLAADEVAVLTRWVELGVPWPEEAVAAGVDRKNFDLATRRAAHWAWQPIGNPPLPDVASGAWPATAVDRFILARLEREGLQPAPTADRRGLIRRLYFDLIGLPPSSEELSAALAEESPAATEQLVDRLLASPRFGERWGRHWLDLVRYCESRGHEYDATIPNAWQYRDYVIRALNADLPYDRFVVEHLAGDLVRPPRLNPSEGFNESILATGFWLLDEATHSPVDIRQEEADRIDNRIDVLGKAFLGMTVACARCHDHKFDAISQRDYYALTGFAVSGSYRQVRFETLERERQIAEQLDQLRATARAELLPQVAVVLRPVVERLADDLLAPSNALWAEELVLARTDPKNPLHYFAVSAAGEKVDVAGSSQPAGAAEQRVIVDYSQGAPPWYADGFAFGLHPIRPGDVLPAADPAAPLRLNVLGGARRDPAWIGLKNAAGVELDYERLGHWDRAGQILRTPEVNLKSGKLWYLVRGPGRAYAPVNSHLLVEGPLHAQTLLEWQGEPNVWQWIGQDLSVYPGHRMHVEFSPLGDELLTIARVVEAAEKPALLPTGLHVITADDTSLAKLAAACQATFLSVLDHLADPTTAGLPLAAEEAALADWLLERIGRLAPLDGATQDERAGRERLAQATARFRAAEAELAAQVPKTSHLAPAMLEGSGADEPLLIRGNPRTPGDMVERRPLEAFAGGRPFEPGTGSGRLALAESLIAADNPLVARVMVNRVWHHLFGVGIVPTVDNFGVLGQAPSHPELLDYLARQFMAEGWSLKRLVRSLVLSRTYQMSSAPTAADAVDPTDALLHRMRLRRLEAEAIRDAILATSGQLDRRQFGPSVPIHLTDDMQGRGRPAASGPLDGAGRASIYLAVRRNFLSPMMLAFDLPLPASTVGRRNVSNVPAQALILLNDPFVDEQALAWARRALQVEQTPEARIGRLYEAALARPPQPAELAAALEFLQSQASELGRSDAWQSDERAWADLAHVMWNSKEFLFVR